MISYQPIDSPPETPDVENPIMDLLIKDEELQAAAETAFNSMQSRRNRPRVRRAVRDHGGSQFAEQASPDQRKAVEEIKILNQNKIMDKFEWLMAASGTAFRTGGAVMMGAGAAVAAGGLAVSAATIAGIKAGGEREIVNQAINDYLEVASRIDKAQQEFDAAWSRLIEDELPDQAN